MDPEKVSKTKKVGSAIVLENLKFSELALTSTMKNTLFMKWQDLHGLSLEQAKLAVENGIKAGAQEGCRTCYIITGRGNHINKQGKRGVIFSECESWLNSKGIKEFVDAYEKRNGHYVVRVKRLSAFIPVEDLAYQITKTFYERNIDALQEAAHKGDGHAQMLLGCGYWLGLGRLKVSYKEGFKYLEKAALQSQGMAQELVGRIYYIGQGVKQSDSRAMEWLEKSVKNGQGGAAYLLSSAYFFGFGCETNIKLCASWAVRGANLADPSCMQRIGNLYLHGYPEEAIPKDMDKAVQWYTRGAAGGDVYSQYQLGCFYLYGNGVKQDEVRAFELFTLAAKAGDADAMIGLGRCYLRGMGCQKNPEKALLWFKKADELNHQEAKFSLLEYYSAIGKTYDRKLLVKESAEQGSIDAQIMMLLLASESGEQENALAQLTERPIAEIIKDTPLFAQLSIANRLLYEAGSKRQKKTHEKKAIKLLEGLEQEGAHAARLILGYYFISKNNLDTAIRVLERGLKLKDPDCVFLLYCLYSKNIAQPEIKKVQYQDKLLQLKHPAGSLLLALDTIFQSEPLLAYQIELLVFKVLSAIEEAQRASSAGCKNTFFGSSVILKKASNILAFILFLYACVIERAPPAISSILSVLCLEKNQSNAFVQTCLGAYCILIDPPLMNGLEYIPWIEDLIRVAPYLEAFPEINLYLLYSVIKETPFSKGINCLRKASEYGSTVLSALLPAMLKDPFYAPQALAPIFMDALIGSPELGFKDINLKVLLDEHIVMCKLLSMNDFLSKMQHQYKKAYGKDESKDESKEECSSLNFPPSLAALTGRSLSNLLNPATKKAKSQPFKPESIALRHEL